MNTINLLNLIPYILLNPLILLAYFVVFSENNPLQRLSIKPFYDVGGNSQRINLGLYLAFCVVTSTAFVAFKLLVLLPLATTPLTAVDITLVQLDWRWLIAYAVTAITLAAFTARAGVEGNIAGFIFAPFIFLSSLLLSAAHVQWLLAEVL